jgi:beta-lactamase superfamily II metal-dependent hydrolase
MTASIYAFDVGQGDCHMIVAGREAIVIDAGPANSPAVDFLKRYGYNIKILILTHNDADHSTGAIKLLAELGETGRIDCVASLQDRASNKQANRAIAMAMELEDRGLLQTWRLETGRDPKIIMEFDDGYTLSLLHPTYKDNLEAIGQHDRRGEGPNRTSAVLRLCDKSRDGIALWSGDLPCLAWQKLADKVDCRARWFVVPHHGSGQGWSFDTITSVLSAVAPKWLIFSVGTDNSYSHPSDNWFRAALAYNAQAVCTQITLQCHHDVTALGGAVLPRESATSSRISKGTACAGTIIYLIREGTVLRADQHQLHISRLSRPMCRMGMTSKHA